MVNRRVKLGAWQRVNNGTYLIFGNLSPDVLVASAVFALPAVVSHRSAAYLHNLRGGDRMANEVTVPHRLSNRFAGVTVHESTDLDPDQIVEVEGLPVTSVARTVFDNALLQSKRQLRGVVDDAIVRRLIKVADLHETLCALGRRGRPGTAAMRELIDSVSADYVAPESELESRMLDLLERSGFPCPTKQMAVPWRTSVDGRIDMAYPDHQLIIECDGRRWHTLAESFERDRRRDNLAQAAGWRILRFTWNDVTMRPLETIRQIRTLLRPIAQ